MEGLADSAASLLGVATTSIYPVSTESAPAYLYLWALCAVPVLCLAFRDFGCRNNKPSGQKRQIRQSRIKNVLFFENLRLKTLGESCDTDQQSAKQPPAALAAFNLIFDKISEESVASSLSIPSTDLHYSRALVLLHARTKAELKEAVDNTLHAQTLEALLKRSPSLASSRLSDWEDGTKLNEACELARKVRKHFWIVHAPTGCDQVDIATAHFDEEYLASPIACTKAEIVAAEKELAKVQVNRATAVRTIFSLLRPSLFVYAMAILSEMLARAFEAPLWANYLPRLKSSIHLFNESAGEGQPGYGPDIVRDSMELCCVFVIGMLFSRLVEILATTFLDKASKSFGYRLRHSVMLSMLQQDTQYFDFNGTSALQNRLNKDSDELVEKLLLTPRDIARDTFRVLQRLFTLYIVAPDMMWWCVKVNVPIFAVVTLVSNWKMSTVRGRQERSSEVSSASTHELLDNIRLVRQFSMEERESRKYDAESLERTKFDGKISMMQDMTNNLNHLAHVFGEVFVIFIALSLAVAGQAKITDAVIGSTVGMWLQHDFKNLVQNVPKAAKVIKPLQKVAALLASRPKIERQSKSKQLLKPKAFRGDIEFKNVTFSYPTETKKQVLGGLSFGAKAGQKVAFVGQAGCGKSTAMDLLQRFYDPTGGEILIDGKPIEDYDPNHLRKFCGVVSQTSRLFSRSIYENIVYGMERPPGPASAEFRAVCEQAQAWTFIDQFPNKQHTLIGVDGVQLSGGQKQRIAIARVLIRRPTFLFLDEATSALDAINEEAVQKSLDALVRGHKGVALVVAHRLTTVCNCDKIVVIGNDGTKVEEGTHEQLLRVPKRVDKDGKPVVGPGLYHTLWDTQQLSNLKQKPEELSNPKLTAKVSVLEEELKHLRAELVTTREKKLLSKHSTTKKKKPSSLRMGLLELPLPTCNPTFARSITDPNSPRCQRTPNSSAAAVFSHTSKQQASLLI